ncbi:uncharacterized protein LOC113240100 [Hyposmocoma kahamanoa]|uniref:uncharacterized protein LOC113240100 n=1 Tax=Hyposmocoma kahamanoa TaxID=1477025 RepID=UPI000E6D5CC7|nr:uncharacterized protein LOC113240100 [Hyposmocoma kahamanoa]
MRNYAAVIALHQPHSTEDIRKCCCVNKKDLLLDGQRARAQWNFLEQLYRVDGRAGKARSIKLTDKHLNPQSYDKMKLPLHTRRGLHCASNDIEIHPSIAGLESTRPTATELRELIYLKFELGGVLEGKMNRCRESVRRRRMRQLDA